MLKTIEKIKLLDAAGKESKKALAECAYIRTFQGRKPIFSESEHVQSICFVLSGYIVLFKTNQQCDRKNIFILGSGEILNEVCLEHPLATVSAETLCNSKILCFASDRFAAIMNSDLQLARAVYNAGMKKVRRLYRQLANSTRMNHLELQLSSKLWKLARDFGHDDENGRTIDFPISITFLADMAGSKRESVSRVIRKLRENGLITCSCKIFSIPDMEILRRFCETSPNS